MLEAMGHDLRAPLARIQLRLDKVRPDSLREKFAANIDEIQSIIEQGLELARSLHTSEKTSPLDIAAFIASIADDLAAGGENVALGDMLEQVFEPYYRLEYSRNRESGGTGLGLSIAHNMVLLNDGSITLSNRPEGGLRARIALPRLEAPSGRIPS